MICVVVTVSMLTSMRLGVSHYLQSIRCSECGGALMIGRPSLLPSYCGRPVLSHQPVRRAVRENRRCFPIRNVLASFTNRKQAEVDRQQTAESGLPGRGFDGIGGRWRSRSVVDSRRLGRGQTLFLFRHRATTVDPRVRIAARVTATRKGVSTVATVPLCIRVVQIVRFPPPGEIGNPIEAVEEAKRCVTRQALARHTSTTGVSARAATWLAVGILPI